MKPFDPSLYAKNDERGREAVKRWLNKRGNQAADFFQYDVDLIVKRGKRWICFVEVEVRSWDVCKFDTIHIAQRKEKLLDNAMPTFMFVCGNSLQTGYFCDAKTVLNSPVVMVKNRLMDKEWFYDVPLHKWKRINLN
jgi:Holliday junction resolvase-like predicted endonuclease